MVKYYKLTEAQFTEINKSVSELKKSINSDLESYKTIIKKILGDYYHIVFLDIRDYNQSSITEDFFDIVITNNRRYELATMRVCSTVESFSPIYFSSHRIPSSDKKTIKLA